MGHSRFSALQNDSHALPVPGISADISCDCSFIFPDISVDNTPVAPRDGMGLKLRSYVAMGGVVLAYDKGAGRILVDPMDDTRPQLSVDTGQTVSAVIHDRVYKRPVRVSRSRMDRHALRFVHDQEIVILIENVERNVLRQDFRLSGLRDLD